MEGVVSQVRVSPKDRLYWNLHKCRKARLRIHYFIIFNLVSGQSPTHIARLLRVARATVYNVAARFRQWGEAGLVDHREGKGSGKLSEDYLAALYEMVRSSTQQHPPSSIPTINVCRPLYQYEQQQVPTEIQGSRVSTHLPC